MIISITGTNTGWSQYVLNGTSKKPRNHSKIQLLRGNIELGDSIITTTNYQHNAYSIVLSFMGKPTLEIINQVVSEFEKYFMYGFSREEYHLDAVAHFDTDDYHVHIRIPKLNLLTHTQLQLYFDKKDRKRINLIRDFLDLKYGLENPSNKRQLIQEKTDFSQQFSKKVQNDLRNIMPIYDYLRELHEANIIQNLDDVKDELKNLDLVIIDNCYDFSRDCYYIKVQFGDKKIKLKGDFFNEEFWRYSREDRSKQILSNKQFRGVLEHSEENYRRVYNALQFELKKRREEIIKRYSTARARANKRVDFTSQKAQKSFAYSQKPFRKKGATSNKTNIFSPCIAAFSHWNGQLLLTKNNSIGKIANYHKGIIHDYTFTRYFLLRRKIREILKKENYESTNRNTLEKSRTTSSERKNVFKLTRAERNSLYQKATRALQSSRSTRFRREQYRKKIDKIGRECAKVEQQFNSNIATINNLIHHLTRETSETTMNYVLHKSSYIKEPAKEEVQLLR
ncbi:relaxase/mobilization nuclease domain-containing protein [Sulfurimonas sp.]